MRFTAIVVSHDNPQGLRYMLENLQHQTVKPDQTVVLYSGEELEILPIIYNNTHFIKCENKNDWGHAKRAEGLNRAVHKYIGFFNDDDCYELNYIEKMTRAAEDNNAEFVYCNWNGADNIQPHLGSSTSGNFIVDRQLALIVGYKFRHYEADGEFINACVAHALKIVKVDDCLYWHNSQHVEF